MVYGKLDRRGVRQYHGVGHEGGRALHANERLLHVLHGLRDQLRWLFLLSVRRGRCRLLAELVWLVNLHSCRCFHGL